MDSNWEAIWEKIWAYDFGCFLLGDSNVAIQGR